MLTTGNALLDVANRHHFAVPAFNISDYAMFNGIIDISEQERAPLIVAIHPDELAHIGTDVILAIRERSRRRCAALGRLTSHFPAPTAPTSSTQPRRSAPIARGCGSHNAGSARRGDCSWSPK